MQQFFEIVAEGRFDPSKIKVTWAAPGSTLKRTEESEAYLADRWKETLAALAAKGEQAWPNDLIPKRVRATIQPTNGGLDVVLDPCVRYYDFSGSKSPEFEQQFGRECVPNAMAVSVFLETADGHMGLTVRNKFTDYKHRGYHLTMGGFFEFWHAKDPKKADRNPTGAALRELDEEVGVKKDDITQLECIGAAYDRMAAHTDIIYHAKTRLSAAEVLARRHDDENVVMMFPNDREHFELFLGGFMHANVVIPMATLLMIGTERFGSQWRGEMINVLADGSQWLSDPATRAESEREDIARFQEYIKSQGLIEQAA